MIEILNEIDTYVFLSLHNIHSDFLDSFMMLFSGRYIWIPFYAALAVLLWRTKGTKSFLAYLVGIGIAIALTDQVCATVIRPLVERMRPANLGNPLSDLVTVVNGYRGGPYGFPSCHAANSFALAAFMCAAVRRRSVMILLVAWAVLNSYSRIYLGVHYPGDLLVGAAIGSAIGYGMYVLSHHLIETDVDRNIERKRIVRPFAEWRLPAVAHRMGHPSGLLPIHAPALVYTVATTLLLIICIISAAA